MKMIPYKDIRARLMQNPEVRAEYERLRPEFERAQRMMDDRVAQEQTPKPQEAV